MAPGLGPLPAASEIDVAGPVSRYLRALPPRQLKLIRLALLGFEWMPFPWRFSRADLESRQRFVSDLERSSNDWHQDLLLLLKILVGLGYGRDARVRAAVGYEMRCEVSGPPPAPPTPSPLGDLTPAAEHEECDVVVVGSGAGGAVAATVLAESGLDVLVLEAGSHHDRCSYPTDPLEALSVLYRDGGLTVAEGRPAVPFPLGRAVGGTTVVNSGTCFRAPERTAGRWRDQFGIDWATGLDGAYAEAEEMLAVRPVDVETMGRNGQLVMEGAASVGASCGPISRNAGDCVQCSSCPAGCRLDAKRAMHVSYLPRAVAAGARIRAEVEVRRITLRDNWATGVRCVLKAPPGSGSRQRPRPYRVSAKAVVLAGGAVGTPELMLRSALPVANPMLGRNLHLHPAAWVGARFDQEVRGWEGIMQSYYVDQWAEMGLLLEATFTPLAFGAQWLPGTGRAHQERVLAYDRVASNGVHLSDSSSGRVALARDGSMRVGYKLTREDARRLAFGIARAAEIFFAAGAREVYSQVRGMPVIRPGGTGDLESTRVEPGDLRLEAFHPMGTARMAADPGQGVTGLDGAVHGMEGLYVADGSLLPTSVGVNPMITIIAFATQVGGAIAERLAPGRERAEAPQYAAQ
jgi:choline dehydrogenase-like flavoprotein